MRVEWIWLNLDRLSTMKWPGHVEIPHNSGSFPLLRKIQNSRLSVTYQNTNNFVLSLAKSLVLTLTLAWFALLKYMLVYKSRTSKSIFSVSRNFFIWILISKISVQMNLWMITKNHEGDPEIGFLTKSISKPYGRATAMPLASELSLDINDRRYRWSWIDFQL